MKYSKYFLIIALLGIVTSCSDFLDRTNPNEPDNVTFWATVISKDVRAPVHALCWLVRW